MRKIVIFTLTSIYMLAMAYLPFVSSFNTQQINVSPVGIAHAQTTTYMKMYCFYWVKKGETTQREECAYHLEGCQFTQQAKIDEYGADNVTNMSSCQYVQPKSSIYQQTEATQPTTQPTGNTTVAQDTTSSNTSNSTLGDECERDAQCGTGMFCSKNQGDEIGHCATGTRPAGGGAGVDGGGGAGVDGGTGAGVKDGGSGTGAKDGGGGAPNFDDCGPTQLCNPLKYNTLCDLLTGLLTLVTQIGAMIAVLLIIWTGFKFITAQGNPKKLTDAKNSFITTLIGTAVLLGASAIAQITIKTVLTITNQNNPGVCHI